MRKLKNKSNKKMERLSLEVWVRDEVFAKMIDKKIISEDELKKLVDEVYFELEGGEINGRC